MFKTQIQATLKAVQLSADGPEWRVANCVLHIPIDYGLAKAPSPRVADALYRVDGMSKYVPRLELHQVKFTELEIPVQRMEFRSTPEVQIPGAVMPGVEVRHVEAIRLKGSEELTLAVQLRFRFLVVERHMASVFLIDHLQQTLWLDLRPMRERLPIIDEQGIRKLPPRRAQGAGLMA
jgi:hypothetical protein